jgi:hypothetical protein
LYSTERKATGTVILYVQFITLSFTFRRGLDLPNCLFLSGFPTANVCVFLIYPVHFSFPTCPTVFQFTNHQHSLTSSNHAAPHCAIFYISLLLPLSSEQISPCYSLCLQNKYLPATPSVFRTNISLSATSSTRFPCLVVGTQIQSQTHHRIQYILYN